MRLSKQTYEEIRSLIRQGKTNEEICSKLNVLDSQVEYQKKKLVKDSKVSGALANAGTTKLKNKIKELKAKRQAKKSNEELVKEVIAKEELVLDSYDKKLDKVPAEQFKKVLDAIGYGSSSSIHISFNNKDYIVEISEVDSEVDIWLITREEYESQYGEIYEEDWEG